MRRPLLLLLAVVLLAAGCGGGSKTYTAAKTRACLKQHNVRIERIPASDFVATTATGGGFRAVLPGTFLTISFGESEDDAVQIEKAYQRFAFPNVKKGLADVLKRDHNAVMLWHQHPQPAQEALILGCLA